MKNHRVKDCMKKKADAAKGIKTSRGGGRPGPGVKNMQEANDPGPYEIETYPGEEQQGNNTMQQVFRQMRA